MDFEETIRIGLMAPLTGIVKIYGTEIIRAAQIACQEVNEQGGIQGRRLELIIEDDGSLPETAVKAAKKLVEDLHCHALIGNLLSNSRISVAFRIAEPRQVPYLCFSLYEGSVLSRYYFHFAAVPNQQIDCMIPYMKEQFGPKMFFAGNNYEWPRGSIDAAKKSLILSGGIVLGEEYCSLSASHEELENILNKLEASNANVFVPYFAGIDQVNLLNHFHRRGLKDKIAVVTSHYDEMMASFLNPEVRSDLYSCNTYFMTVNTQENQNFLQKLAKLKGVNGIWPAGNGIITNFGEGTYLCVKAFAKAANSVSYMKSDDLIRSLESIRLSGPQGIVEMNPENHHAKVNTYFAQCQADGSFTIIKKFGEIAPVIPDRYRNLYLNPEAELGETVRIQSRIVEQMTEAIFFIGSQDGKIFYVNAGGERMFNYGRGELIGKTFYNLMSKNEPTDKIIHQIDTILYQKGIWKGEQHNIKKDGTLFWTSISISTFTHPVHGEVWMAIYRDITEQKKLAFERNATEKLLVEQEKLFSSVFHTLPVIVFIKDISKKFEYKYWNNFAEKIIGLKSEDVIGKTDYDLFSKERADWFRKKDIEACECQEIIDIPEDIVITKNGPIIFHTKKMIVRDAIGKPLYLVGVSEDITEIKKVADDLRLAVNVRDEFLNIASHELKTPITSLKLRIQNLHRKLIDPEFTYEFTKLDDQIDRLTTLIETILDVTRIQQGKLNLKTSKVNLSEIISLLVDQFSHELKAAHCKIDVSISPKIVGYWDKSRIEQIISNLFSNTIKYAHDSQISIDASQDENKTIIHFKDTGQGIPSEKRDLVFNPYERGSPPSGVSGFGLGLYVCKQIVAAHHGKIEIEKNENAEVGTSILIELPNISENYLDPSSY